MDVSENVPDFIDILVTCLEYWPVGMALVFLFSLAIRNRNGLWSTTELQPMSAETKPAVYGGPGPQGNVPMYQQPHPTYQQGYQQQPTTYYAPAAGR
jgi:hypothetical protein